MSEAQAGIRVGTKPQPAGKTWSHPLIELTLARMREFVRQPEAVFWVFGFPVLMAFALGIAFRNTAPEKVRVAVDAGAPYAAETAAAISRSAGLEARLLPSAEAAIALRTGKVALVVMRSSGTAYEFRYDPTRPESQNAKLMTDDALQRAAGRKDLATVREETFTEPGARYIDFLIPGLIGLNLMGSGMWGLGFAIVMARTQKLLKRLAATPMRRWHFLLSFMLSRLVFLFLEVAAVLGFAYLVFGVKIYGSVLGFLTIAIIGSMTFAGIGLLIGARVKTIEAASGWMNLVMLPMWLLSGSFFSAAKFPDVMQPFIRALPLTALNDALRSVMNDGAPLTANLLPIAILIAWGLVSFFVALKIFRWQ